MSAADLLIDLSAKGVRLSIAGDRIKVDAPKGVLTADLIDTIKANKQHLITALTATDDNIALYADDPDARECGLFACFECSNFRGHESVCAAGRCPTPRTLWRRCEHHKPKAKP